jgi:ankyrin repeat protein
MRTAAFGSAAELKALLDRGLNPNSKTEGGTTILMMAAPDIAKLKLLVEDGADVKAKARSGYTATMVASLYQGSGEALKFLLDHGAEAAPGKGVSFNASRLMLAAMAGDPGNVTLLHAKGADPNRKMLLIGVFPTSPLSVAATTGDVPTIRALLAAGADIRELDEDGLNLLDFVVLANHVEAAQALIAAGVAVNQTDSYGYTPLLYASTVDFGDSRMVDLLLSAGANPNLRNKQGKTALGQAKAYRFSYIEASLERAGARE